MSFKIPTANINTLYIFGVNLQYMTTKHYQKYSEKCIYNVRILTFTTCMIAYINIKSLHHITMSAMHILIYVNNAELAYKAHFTVEGTSFRCIEGFINLL